MAAPAVAVLSEIGEDTETTGRKDRLAKAKTIGAELARRAQNRGSLDPSDFAPEKGQGKEAMAEMLKILDSRKDELSPKLATQVAAALANSVIKVQVVPTATAPYGEASGE